MTCQVCVPVPTLSPEQFILSMAGKHLQFWGDSVTAQAECDLRTALLEGGQHCVNETHKGAECPSINASSSYLKTGCPWGCNQYPKVDKNGHREALGVKDLLLK